MVIRPQKQIINNRSKNKPAEAISKVNKYLMANEIAMALRR